MKINLFTRFLLLTGVVLLVYGYVAVLAGWYFFWESRSIGLYVLLLGAASFLANRMSYQQTKGQSTIPEKIGLGFLGLMLIALLLGVGIFYFSEPFSAAEKFVQTDSACKAELGKVHGLGFLATGSITIQNDYGTAVLEVLVKGEQKLAYKTLYLSRTPDSPEWQVEGVE